MLLLFNTTLGPPTDSFAKEINGKDPETAAAEDADAIEVMADRREISGDGNCSAHDVSLSLSSIMPTANSTAAILKMFILMLLLLLLHTTEKKSR